MEHNVSLITTLAAGFGLALVLGFCAERLRIPALVGYLLAGIAIGPFTPGFVADQDIANQIESETAQFLLSDAGSPTVVKDQSDEGALYVLMPMRV